MEDILYEKMAEQAIQKGFASNVEADELLDSLPNY